MQTDINQYNDGLLTLVKEKGILVETIITDKPFSYEKRTTYPLELGVIPIKNKQCVITNVYIVYEDNDHSIKYYDYPQPV